MGEETAVSTICEKLPKYSEEDVYYSCLKLAEARLVAATFVDMDAMTLPEVDYIYDITFRGHEFLGRIKDESRWKGIKKALPMIRDYSIDAINAVANGFASAAISAFFSSNQQP